MYGVDMTARSGTKISTLPISNTENQVADEIIPYIKFDPKSGGGYRPIELTSFPFPPHHLPQVFNLPLFIIEKNKYGYFLRSTLNSLFCSALYEVVSEIEVPDWDPENMSYKYNEEGEVIHKIERLQYLCFTVEGEERAVAYRYEGSGKTYLQLHTSEIPFEELDEKLQKLYLGAKLLSRHYITHYENEIRKLEAKATGLTPKGEWEAQMFRDVFRSNTSLMSDDEYEMIFGVER